MSEFHTTPHKMGASNDAGVFVNPSYDRNWLLYENGDEGYLIGTDYGRIRLENGKISAEGYLTIFMSSIRQGKNVENILAPTVIKFKDSFGRDRYQSALGEDMFKPPIHLPAETLNRIRTDLIDACATLKLKCIFK
jgi:hypothetical protein